MSELPTSEPSIEEQIAKLPSKQVEALRLKIGDERSYDNLTPEQAKTLRAYISFWMGSDQSRRYAAGVKQTLANLDSHVEFIRQMAEHCGMPARDIEHANLQAAVRRNAVEKDKNMAAVFPDAIGSF